MKSNNPGLSIDTIYASLVSIIKNDDQKPLAIVGSYIVGATMAEEGIDVLFEKYPILEDIAEIGASLEHQDEQYFNEYYQQLKIQLDKLGRQINSKEH